MPALQETTVRCPVSATPAARAATVLLPTLCRADPVPLRYAAAPLHPALWRTDNNPAADPADTTANTRPLHRLSPCATSRRQTAPVQSKGHPAPGRFPAHSPQAVPAQPLFGSIRSG